MRHKYTKVLYTHKSEGSLPQLIIAENENSQSKFVVQKILELREEGVPLEDIAVLFRSSFLSFDLEIELAKANIPFLKFGGFKFIETAHVKDMIAYLRVLENPRDVVAWNRILLLIDGVGPRTAEKIIDDILHRRAERPSSPFWEQYNSYPANVKELFEVMKSIASEKYPPAEKASRITTYYHPMFKKRYDDYTKRKKDLEMFEQIAARYSDVGTLLADLALEPPNESIADVTPPGIDDEYLTLSTIHSAKGLEWNSVFLIYALDGRFPTSRAVNDLDEMEEERRLMYVACTRAKEHLFITYPINVYDRETGTILTKPSRFLEGLDEKLLEPWVIGEE
ncbi:MAG: ATP-binding domain-containing protein [Ignavibacteriales bacterium]|nr:ATP-binding domain-containing protein [Ignavibacteriales bacterium]